MQYNRSFPALLLLKKCSLDKIVMCSQSFVLVGKSFDQKSFLQGLTEKSLAFGSTFLKSHPVKNCFLISTFPYLNKIWRRNSYFCRQCFSTDNVRENRIFNCSFSSSCRKIPFDCVYTSLNFLLNFVFNLTRYNFTIIPSFVVSLYYVKGKKIAFLIQN